MKRIAVLIYGIVCYSVGMGSLFYLMGWLSNLVVPYSIDSAPTQDMWSALLINMSLFALFGIQHSVMARPWFKEWLTRMMPREMERSTYVLLSGLLTLLMMWQWRPLGGVIWNVEQPMARAGIYATYLLGWAILVGSTFVINHFDLFGLRQVWLQFVKKRYSHLHFATPGPYRLVRHPLYVGWITLAWATPTMTMAHLMFAVATTAYILIAIPLEEKDLVRFHGRAYEQYRRRVPKLIPWLPNRSVAADTTRQTETI